MNRHDIDIRLITLRELSPLCNIHHWEMMRYDGSPVEVNLTTSFKKIEGANVVVLRLGVNYTTMRAQIIRKLFDYVIEAEFEIVEQDSDTSFSDGDVVVPTDILALMLSIGIGGLRGMIALRTQNTFLHHYPLPVYNLDTLIENIIFAGKDVTASAAFA